MSRATERGTRKKVEQAEEAEARKKKHFAIPLLPASDADAAQAKALKRAGGFRTDNFKVSGFRAPTEVQCS